MNRNSISVIAAAGAASFLVGTSQLAVAETPAAELSPKQLMGQNFGVLQSILYALIKGDYRAIPGQADLIVEHEDQLKKLAGDYADAELAQFLAYAGNMGGHARDLKSISTTLMQHDAKRPTPGYDHLREALASHYGGMVTMCVSCHNRFRPEAAE